MNMSNPNIGDKKINNLKCVHGHIGYCGLCKAETEVKAGRVCKHGNPFFCGHCGNVSDIKKEVK